MTLMTLGDSHSLFSFAGVSNARIFWRGPVTMHRAARDGIASLVPKNCRPEVGDVLILSFGEIDSRTHIPRLARANGRPTSEEADLLLDRFEQALLHFRASCPAIVALSCIVPFNPAFLEPQWYGSDEECRVNVKDIRDRMNARMAAMGVPFIDFRAGYSLPDGSIAPAFSDDNVHIDARHSEPVLAALHAALPGDFSFREPPWPPHPLAEGPYQSPWKRFRRAVRARFKAIVFKQRDTVT
ncbi:SGNH/GDSL hydrolase family protein [Aminobacter anthyllidis]|uniref:SGNH/GDSL hydrolase family protein n=1 Tax=Aminobacter anthyllidis TaxID=1035067 RepID=UPI00245897B0|nr:SGNH/GDSL hydrolase family protein [Aminobacter anthyllidis]MDH4985233.1 SGNH/GDSL hydrolase family protein [Aminobacter anthyllidis]